MNYLLMCLIFFLVMTLANANALEYTYEKLILKQKFLDSLLNPKRYNSKIRPPANSSEHGPVEVGVKIYVRSLSEIDDVNMEYSAQIILSQTWKDERLQFNNDERLEYLMVPSTDLVWKPDLFFPNELTAHIHHVTIQNELIRIVPIGYVMYSLRLSLKLHCPMDLSNYPLDRQVCPMVMASYGYNTENIVFNWKEKDPVQISKNLTLPRFRLETHLVDYCNIRTNTGEYSCLKVQFVFIRDRTYHIFQTYISTTAIVLLSWLSLFLNRKSTMVRIAIWISAVLCMFIKATSIFATTPAVSYTKAVDVWIGTCMFFIFCVVIELSIVNNVVAAEDEKSTICLDKSKELRTFTFIPLRWLNRYPSKAQRIDTVSRILFPAAFVFFNVVYWLTYPVQHD